MDGLLPPFENEISHGKLRLQIRVGESLPLRGSSFDIALVSMKFFDWYFNKDIKNMRQMASLQIKFQGQKLWMKENADYVNLVSLMFREHCKN